MRRWLRFLAFALAVKLILKGVAFFFLWKTMGLSAYLPEGDIADFARRPVLYLRGIERSDVEYVDWVYPLWVEIDSLPKHVWLPFMVAEDHRFFRHPGISPSGVVSALVDGRQRGGSTITMQVARLLFLNSARSWSRKIREAVLAVWLTAKLSKQQVLEIYLNRIALGQQSYGVEFAARRYFGRAASELDLLEAAALAVTPPEPGRYNPRISPNVSIKRAKSLIKRMVEEGFISAADAQEALDREDFRTRGNVPLPGSNRFYARDFALQELRRLDLEVRPGETVRLVLTIDPQAQRYAERAIAQAQAEQGEAVFDQAAIVVLDRRSNIRALLGGTDYSASQWNRATQALRPPASTFKPFAYLAAAELEGFTATSVCHDKPFAVKDGRPWPANPYPGYLGNITLGEALAKSSNGCVVNLVKELGPKRVIEFAARFWSGVLEPIPAVGLGVGETSLLNLTQSYAMVANGGLNSDVRIILEVRGADGRVIRHVRQHQERVVSRRAACMIGSLLQGVVTSRGGTGHRAAFQTPVAGKTGTSPGNRDGWFIGYSRDFVSGVWLGNEQGVESKLSGGTVPAKTFRNLMANLHLHLPVRELDCV